MNRLGRGYSFEALRAKILFTEGAHKLENTRPKFERRREMDTGIRFSFPSGVSVAAFAATSEGNNDEAVESSKNYGADITTLVSLLEAGRL